MPALLFPFLIRQDDWPVIDGEIFQRAPNGPLAGQLGVGRDPRRLRHDQERLLQAQAGHGGPPPPQALEAGRKNHHQVVAPPPPPP